VPDFEEWIQIINNICYNLKINICMKKYFFAPIPAKTVTTDISRNHDVE